MKKNFNSSKITPTITYNTLDSIKGPLIFLKNVDSAMYGEIIHFHLPDGTSREAQVLEVQGDVAVAQIFDTTTGLDTLKTVAEFSGELYRFPVSSSALGRTFNGVGKPLDGEMYLPEDIVDVNGLSINPVAREYPRQLLETGFSAIDVMLSIAQGQKIPIFSGSGLPHNQLAADIVKNSKVYRINSGKAIENEDETVVVMAGMGLNNESVSFFKDSFETNSENLAFFINKADDPTVERLLTPRLALSLAEYLAFEEERNVLVIMTDMTSYADALREVAAARDEVPGRRGYPAYMYTDLSSIYERAGRITGKKGSLTQIPILTMPNDDISHPVPDLTGFITEGQIMLSRTLSNKNIYPPIDVLPSLSRLMKCAETREDHGDLAGQLYSIYADGKEAQAMKAVVGEQGLEDKLLVEFVENFESRFLNQNKKRNIFESLELGWEMLRILPANSIKKISKNIKDKYFYK